MTTELEKRLEPFLFPVMEKEVHYSDLLNRNTVLTKDYKAIVRKDNGELISIMNDTYKIVPNREVIKPLMEQLNLLDTSWFIDSSHSFVENNRMRLQVTFPELIFSDGRSDVSLSLFLHNSYDGSEGVRMFWGAIRAICKNGMVFGEVLSKFYGKHTAGLNIGNLHQQVEATYEKIPVIKHRIEQLLNEKVTDAIRMSIENKLGKKVMKYVEEQEEERGQKAKNLWVLYNFLTYFISHNVQQRLRANYQFEVSKLFKL
jgi:regulator of replication initiation timing